MGTAGAEPGAFTLRVVVPFCTSLIWALLAGLLVALGIRAYSGAWAGWEIVCFVAVLVAVLSWARTQADFRALLLWPMEQWTGADLDGDGIVGDPGGRDGYVLINPPAEPVQADPVEQKRRALIEFVRGCQLRTDIRYWTEDRGMSVEDYRYFRDNILIRTGWAAWNSPGHEKQGWALQYPAAAIVSKIE